MSSYIILLYFGTILGFALFFSARKVKSSEDFFFDGGRTPGTILGSSLLLSNLLRYQILLMPVMALEFSWIAIAVSLGVVLLSYLATDGEPVDVPIDFCGSHAGQWFANALMLMTYGTLQIAALFVVTNVFLGQLVGVDYSTAILLMIVISGLYTIVGGFSAVVHAQAIQGVVFLGGLIALVFLQGIPSPLSVFPTLASEHPASLGGAILGLPVMSLWVWRFDRLSSQQVRSSRDAASRNKGLLVGVSLALVIVVLVALSMRSGPHDLRYSAAGNVLGILCFALLMPSLAATFTSFSELTSNGFFRGLRPDASEQEVVLVGRLSTAAIVGLSILMIPLAARGGAWTLDLYILAQVCLFPPIAAVYSARLMSRDSVSRAVIAGLIVGELLGITRFALELADTAPDLFPTVWTWYLSIDRYLFAFGLFSVSMVVMFGVSAFARARSSLALRSG